MQFIRSGFAVLFHHDAHNIWVQLFRYGIVAGFGLVVDVGGLVVLKEVVGWNYLAAATVSFVVALVVNYILSTWWIFKQTRFASRWHDFGLYGLIGLVGLGLNDLLLWLFTGGLGWHYLLSKGVATVLVFGWNFMGRKFMYRPTTDAPATDAT